MNIPIGCRIQTNGINSTEGFDRDFRDQKLSVFIIM